jgi:hypothetical protein
MQKYTWKKIQTIQTISAMKSWLRLSYLVTSWKFQARMIKKSFVAATGSPTPEDC